MNRNNVPSSLGGSFAIILLAQVSILIVPAGKMSITKFFIEAFDEDWKGEPNDPLGAEEHWGLFTANRKAKSAMYDLHPDLAPVKAMK
jgi:hypothetical protein